MSIDDDIAAVRKIAAIYEAGGVWHNLTMTEDAAVKVRLADEVGRLRKENAELRLDGKGCHNSIDALERLLAKAVEALRLVKQTLTIPAAEYVPAITDAWDIIDAVLKELEK